jgi:putative transposase
VDCDKPLHVTLRAKKDVPSFRSKRRYMRMRESIRAASVRFGMRVVHFTLMDNHVHLIVEAMDRRALTRGMQGLAIRLAKSANGKWRDGKVFRDRYHAVVLESPRQVRSAVAYVLLNGRRHTRPAGPAEGIDPCSSGHWFGGWSVDVTALKVAGSVFIECSGKAPVAAPRTWLLGVGWKRLGLIDPSEVPGAG